MFNLGIVVLDMIRSPVVAPILPPRAPRGVGMFLSVLAAMIGGAVPGFGAGASSIRLSSAPHNPEFVRYVASRQGRLRISAAVGADKLGDIPSPVDLSHLKGAAPLGARPQAG